MKYFYLTITLFFSLNSFSQNDVLGDWFLHYIEVDGVQQYSTIPNSSMYHYMNFDETNTFNGQICANGYGGDFSINNNSQLSLSNITSFAGFCNYVIESQLFLNTYLSNVLVDDDFVYSIVGTGLEETLILTNSQNNSAVYGRSPLPENRLPGVWYLHSIVKNGIEELNTFNPNFQINFTLTPGSFSGIDYDGTAICNDYFGEYFLEGIDNISLIGFVPTLAICNDMSENAYEDSYRSFFDDNDPNTNLLLNYSISGTNDDEFLNLTNQNGDYLVYGRQAPSISADELLGEWSLQSLIVDGVQENYISDQASINFTSLPGDNNGLHVNGLAACNSFGASYIPTSDNTFEITSFLQSLGDCNVLEDQDFDNLYFYDILYSEGDSNPTHFQYTITGEGINRTLTMTNTDNNNVAIYGNTNQNGLIGEWFLHYIIDLDVPVYSTDYPNTNIIFTESNGTFNFNGSSSCNTFNGITTSLEDAYFEATPPTWTSLECDGDDYLFEQTYKNFFFFNFDNSTSTRYDYVITGDGDDAILEIYNTVYDEESQTNIGYFASFGRQTLSVSENQLNNLNVRLKENPITDELSLLINESLGDQFTYQIYSVDGKLIQENQITRNHTISVNSLNAGMYFLMISSEDNFKQTLKFIKK